IASAAFGIACDDDGRGDVGPCSIILVINELRQSFQVYPFAEKNLLLSRTGLSQLRLQRPLACLRIAAWKVRNRASERQCQAPSSSANIGHNRKRRSCDVAEEDYRETGRLFQPGKDRGSLIPWAYRSMNVENLSRPYAANCVDE